MMVLQIPLTPAAEAGLRAKADAAGMDLQTYVSRHLERLALGQQSVGSPSSSDMTDDELAAFLEDEKHAMRRERRTL